MSDDQPVQAQPTCGDCGSDRIVGDVEETATKVVQVRQVEHPPGESWACHYQTTTVRTTGRRSSGVGDLRCDECGSRDVEYVEVSDGE